MSSYNRPNHPQDDAPAGSCKVCGGFHSQLCCVPHCNRPGTLTESVSHGCAGMANWYCTEHFFGNRDARTPARRGEMKRVCEMVASQESEVL